MRSRKPCGAQLPGPLRDGQRQSLTLPPSDSSVASISDIDEIVKNLEEVKEYIDRQPTMPLQVSEEDEMCVDPMNRAFRERHQMWECRLTIAPRPDCIWEEYWEPPAWLVAIEPEKL
eukprot:10582000-Karenia_brevis.AAC.1